MANIEFDLENVIPVTEANLRDEQKQPIAKAMEDYKQQCLKSFSINRSGKVIPKEALPNLGRLLLKPILVNFKTWLIVLLTVP